MPGRFLSPHYKDPPSTLFCPDKSIKGVFVPTFPHAQSSPWECDDRELSYNLCLIKAY